MQRSWVPKDLYWDKCYSICLKYYLKFKYYLKQIGGDVCEGHLIIHNRKFINQSNNHAETNAHVACKSP